MKKRILTAALCFCMMVVFGATPAAAAGHPFRDVSDSHWANEAVSYVYNQGLMNGTGTQAFSLNGNLTRAMFVTILGRTSGMIESEYTGTSYSDIAPGQWYSPYVEWASCWNIAGGYGNGRFGPNDLVTREQMAAMIARYVDSYGIELEESSEAVDNFQDEYAVSPWAEEGVDLMRRTGILSGYKDGTFAPKQTATRAEAAIMVMRLTTLLGWDETPEEPVNPPMTNAKTAQEIVDAMKSADIFTQNWFYDNIYTDKSDTFMAEYLGGSEWSYERITYPGISTLQDVRNLTRQYYTAEVAEEAISCKQWIERDGKLYVSATEGIGGGAPIIKSDIAIQKDGDTRYIITVYDYWYGESTPDSYDICYEYVDGYWVFDTFLLLLPDTINVIEYI